MEHNSNLFGDASFLAVPAIHFFGFPGYYTSTPPRLPAVLFENPERRARLREQMKEESTGSQPWLCGCLAKGDPHHLDVTFCRQEHSVEDITIRFSESPAAEGKGEGSSQAKSSSSQPNNLSDGAPPSASMKPVSQNSGDTTDNIAEMARREALNFPPRSSTAPPSLSLTPTQSTASLHPATDEEARPRSGLSPTRNIAPPIDFTPSTPPAVNRMTHTPLEREELMMQEDVQAISEASKEAPALPKEVSMPKGDIQQLDAEDKPEEVKLAAETDFPPREETQLDVQPEEQKPAQQSDDVAQEPKIEEAVGQQPQVREQMQQEEPQTAEEVTKVPSETVNM